MRVDAGVCTNPGRKRSRNEDFPVSDAELGLFLVIDGMGGHARGTIATRRGRSASCRTSPTTGTA